MVLPKVESCPILMNEIGGSNNSNQGAEIGSEIMDIQLMEAPSFFQGNNKDKDFQDKTRKPEHKS